MTVDFKVPAGLPHQVSLWKDRTHKRELAMIGGQGTGKTHGLAVKMALLSAINAPLDTGLVVPSFPTFDKVHRQSWPSLLWECGVPVRITGGANPEIRWPWGGRTYVYSAEHAGAIVGSNLAAAGMDEPAQCDREAYERITSRIRHPKAKCMQFAATGTPEGIPSWFADVFDIHQTVTGEGGWSRRTIRARSWHPDVADYANRLKETYGFSEALLQTYALGMFVPLTSGRVYTAFDPAQHVRTDVEHTESLPLYLACDFNIGHMRWLVAQVKPGQVQVLDEIAMGSHGPVSEAAEEFVKRYHPTNGTHGNHPPVREVVVVGDASGTSRHATGHVCYDELLTVLRRVWPSVKVSVPKANPLIRDRVATVNWNLSGQGLEQRIHPDCSELIRDLSSNVWKSNGQGIDDQSGERGHAGDAYGYLLYRVARLTRPAHDTKPFGHDRRTYRDAVMGADF